MYGHKWQLLLGYGSRDTRCIDFPRVDRLSTDTPDLGRHSSARISSIFVVFFALTLFLSTKSCLISFLTLGGTL